MNLYFTTCFLCFEISKQSLAATTNLKLVTWLFLVGLWILYNIQKTTTQLFKLVFVLGTGCPVWFLEIWQTNKHVQMFSLVNKSLY